MQEDKVTPPYNGPTIEIPYSEEKQLELDRLNAINNNDWRFLPASTTIKASELKKPMVQRLKEYWERKIKELRTINK